MAHNGDADAHNELLARNDGNTLEYNIALQDALNRQSERVQAAQAQDQYAQESTDFSGKNPAQGPELLDAIKQVGGLPHADTGGLGLTDELETLREGAPKGLFNRGQRNGLDRVRESLAQKGFLFETPDDMLQAVDQRLRSGKPRYGQIRTATEAQGQQPKLRYARSASASNELNAAFEARLQKHLEDQQKARQIQKDANAKQLTSGNLGAGDSEIQRPVGDYDELAKNGHDSPEHVLAQTRSLGEDPTATKDIADPDRNKLYEWAVGKKRLIPIRAMQKFAEGRENIGQSEHEVYPVPEANKMVKVTHAGKYGLSHTLDNYLKRMDDQNRLAPGLNIRFLGFTPDVDSLFPKAVTDMTMVAGVEPSSAELHNALIHRYGFEQEDRGRLVYRHKDTGVEISDAHAGNFLKDPDGNFIPIDIDVRGDVTKPIFVPKDGEARFARGEGDGKNGNGNA